MNEFHTLCVDLTAMARFQLITAGVQPDDFRLNPGCNVLGREGENDLLIPHPSVSRRHCELWLTEDAVLVRDLESRNGTYVDGERVTEAQVGKGQTLRLGDVEMVLVEAPVRIAVPDVPLPPQPRQQLFMEDGTPCCFRHDSIAAAFCCGKCSRCFCGQCVRKLGVAGGTPRRFCPECGGPCERLAPTVREEKRAGWLNKLVKVLMKPPPRR